MEFIMILQGKFPQYILSVLLAIVVPILFLPSLSSAQSVSATVSKQGAQTAIINIQLANPAPANLIVQMSLPPGNSLASASPKANKYDKKNNILKWLFKNTSPGSMHIAVTTQKPLAPERAPVLVRYRDPRSKQITEVRASSKQ